jgi:hypothetical protein
VRLPVLTLALFVIPASVGAQQAELGGEPVAPRVELERTTPAQPATEAGPAALSAVQPSVPAGSVTPAPDAADPTEGPTARRWWWLVGAVLAGGLLLSLLL